MRYGTRVRVRSGFYEGVTWRVIREEIEDPRFYSYSTGTENQIERQPQYVVLFDKEFIVESDDEKSAWLTENQLLEI